MMIRPIVARLALFPLVWSLGCSEGDPPPGTGDFPSDDSTPEDDGMGDGTTGTGEGGNPDAGDNGDSVGDDSGSAGEDEHSEDAGEEEDSGDAGDESSDAGEEEESSDAGDEDSGDSGGTGDSGDSGEEDSGGSSEDGGDSGDDGGDPPGSYAENISLTTVELNQGLQAIIGEDGDVVAPDITLVAGRAGLLRAFWQTEGGWTNREIVAQLTLSYEDGSSEVLNQTRMISGPPDPDSVDGAFNWLLTPDQIQAGMEYSVGLYETSDTGNPDPSPLPRIPQSGTGDMGIPDEPMILEIVFVPMTISGVTPDMSAANVQDLVDGYHNMNPVSEVQMTLHSAITGSSTNPSTLLSQISQLRSSESPDPQVYYIGLAAVSQTGWTGVSYVPGATMNGDRSSFSPISNTPGNYPSDNSWGFTVHETGHAQGMPHNPGCGAGGPNPDWPWGSTTTIDRQGYDLANDVFRQMGDSEDYMNYCTPDWQSSFTWENTADRIRILSGWRTAAPERKAHLLKGLVSLDGSGPPVWWSVPGNPDPGLQDVAVADLQVMLDDGGLVNVQGTSQILCGDNLVSIEAVLPTTPDDLSHIVVVAEGETYDVATAGLTAQYDEYVRLYGSAR